MTHLAKRMFVAAVAVGIAAGLVVGGASRPATRSSAPSPHFLAAARTALVTYLHHSDPLAKLTAHRVLRNAVTKSDSYNWSGYADTATAKDAFTGVSGSWTIPPVRCTKEDQLTSEWIGLDGANDGTVEQDGSLSWCFEGKATYFTWYEMFPAGTISVGTSPWPGDKIVTSIVARSSGANNSYTMKLADDTRRKNSFTITKSCAKTTCLDESAEWVAERPEFEIGIAPLADYGKWTMTGGTVTAKGKTGPITSASPTEELAMIDATQSYVLSNTSGLTAGKTFSTTWENSY